VHRIGCITAGRGLVALDASGSSVDLTQQRSYDHFQAGPEAGVGATSLTTVAQATRAG
jgi:hypothetical protein